MAPVKSNADNACCYNLCNTFWNMVGMFACNYPSPLLSVLCINEMCGCYDCVWLTVREWKLEPPYVKAWNRLVNSKPGGPAVFG